MEITISTNVAAPLSECWRGWITPEAITQWNFASADWHCPSAESDFQVGGRFSYRMAAKDGSMAFDFEGTFDVIEEHKRIKFTMPDNRRVIITFEEQGNETRVSETFDAEDQNSAEMQRQGWQAILDNYAKYVTSS